MVMRFVLCLLLGISASALSAPSAELNRAEVNLGDSLTLTIRVEGSGSSRPDLSPLEPAFRILGTSQSSRHSLVNGRAESWTEWRTTLMPKREGRLQIPAIAVGTQFTQPLVVEVRPPAATPSIDNPVFLEADVNRDTVYVEAELILTVRVFQGIVLDEMTLQPPAFDNATVELLSEASFDRQINGRRFQVHERRYGIYPHAAGELVIPELVFNALQPTSRRSLFDLPGQGVPLQRLSPQLTVTVKPPPAGFPGSVWLPARDLDLSQQWQGDTQGLKVGDSLVREVRLKAEGLLASQLPTLPKTDLGTARIYPAKPDLENTPNATGMRSLRKEQFTLLPTEPGTLSLPPVRIPWWDTEADRLRWAELPRTELRVARALGAGRRDSSAINAEPAPPAAAPEPSVDSASPSLLWPWQLLSALLAAAWLLTLILWWRSQRPHPTPAMGATRPLHEAAAFKAFKAACEARQPAQAERCLLDWLRIHQEAPEATLGALLRSLDNKALSTEVARLQQRLYAGNQGSDAWQGRGLFTAADAVRKQAPRAAPAKAEALPALYPGAR